MMVEAETTSLATTSAEYLIFDEDQLAQAAQLTQTQNDIIVPQTQDAVRLNSCKNPSDSMHIRPTTTRPGMVDVLWHIFRRQIDKMFTMENLAVMRGAICTQLWRFLHGISYYVFHIDKTTINVKTLKYPSPTKCQSLSNFFVIMNGNDNSVQIPEGVQCSWQLAPPQKFYRRRKFTVPKLAINRIDELNPKTSHPHKSKNKQTDPYQRNYCNNDPASSNASRAHSKLSFRSPSEENILQEEEATSDDDDDTSSMTSNLTSFTVRTNAATSAIDTNRMCDLEQQFATLQKKMDLLLKLQQNAQPQNSTEDVPQAHQAPAPSLPPPPPPPPANLFASTSRVANSDAHGQQNTAKSQAFDSDGTNPKTKNQSQAPEIPKKSTVSNNQSTSIVNLMEQIRAGVQLKKVVKPEEPTLVRQTEDANDLASVLRKRMEVCIGPDLDSSLDCTTSIADDTEWE